MLLPDDDEEPTKDLLSYCATVCLSLSVSLTSVSGMATGRTKWNSRSTRKGQIISMMLSVRNRISYHFLSFHLISKGWRIENKRQQTNERTKLAGFSQFFDCHPPPFAPPSDSYQPKKIPNRRAECRWNKWIQHPSTRFLSIFILLFLFQSLLRRSERRSATRAIRSNSWTPPEPICRQIDAQNKRARRSSRSSIWLYFISLFFFTFWILSYYFSFLSVDSLMHSQSSNSHFPPSFSCLLSLCVCLIL